jgi:phosphoribosyl-ATP pyrophosphohydrolase/phosphoribosyl-AMP cyclohydrolase
VNEIERIIIKQDDRGLVPAVIQHSETGQVLMLAYVSPKSLKLTIEQGEIWFYSRSRQELWHKGETSGNYLKLISISTDCDGDSLLIKVMPTGPACHTGENSCFFTEIKEFPEFNLSNASSSILNELFSLIEERSENPIEGSYTNSLLEGGAPKIAQKIIEEAGETAIEVMQGNKKLLISEVADLFYHTIVSLVSCKVSINDVWEELRGRRG